MDLVDVLSHHIYRNKLDSKIAEVDLGEMAGELLRFRYTFRIYMYSMAYRTEFYCISL